MICVHCFVDKQKTEFYATRRWCKQCCKEKYATERKQTIYKRGEYLIELRNTEKHILLINNQKLKVHFWNGYMIVKYVDFLKVSSKISLECDIKNDKYKSGAEELILK